MLAAASPSASRRCAAPPAGAQSPLACGHPCWGACRSPCLPGRGSTAPRGTTGPEATNGALDRSSSRSRCGACDGRATRARTADKQMPGGSCIRLSAACLAEGDGSPRADRPSSRRASRVASSPLAANGGARDGWRSTARGFHNPSSDPTHQAAVMTPSSRQETIRPWERAGATPDSLFFFSPKFTPRPRSKLRDCTGAGLQQSRPICHCLGPVVPRQGEAVSLADTCICAAGRLAPAGLRPERGADEQSHRDCVREIASQKTARNDRPRGLSSDNATAVAREARRLTNLNALRNIRTRVRARHPSAHGAGRAPWVRPHHRLSSQQHAHTATHAPHRREPTT